MRGTWSKDIQVPCIEGHAYRDAKEVLKGDFKATDPTGCGAVASASSKLAIKEETYAILDGVSFVKNSRT